jgi:TonB family protein
MQEWMKTTGKPWILALAILLPGSLVSQQTGSPVQLLGTALRVQLPAGWKLEPPRQPSQQHLLTTTAEPRYELWVSQTTPKTIGYSCMDLIGSTQSAMQSVPGLGSAIQPRPAFVPNVYMGSILNMTDIQLACLSTGDNQIGVTIQARGGSSKPEVLTPMLAAIADAALKQSGAVSSPGRLTLPLLGIEIPLRDGVWGVREATTFWGRSDVLGRAAKPGSSEVNISPFLFPLPGRCENLGTTSPFAGISPATFVKERHYGGDRWYPGAWEQFPPPFKALMAYACRNVGANSILLARIEYERSNVPDADLNVIRQMLDDIGNAAEARGISRVGRPAVPTEGAAAPNSLVDPQILSPNPQGIDFGPYLNRVMTRIRTNWFALMPAAAIQGDKGRVDTVFTITREGTVTDLQLVAASGNPTLDKTVTTAIQTSSPFPALPADFKGDGLKLRIAFLHNLPPRQ